MADNPLLVVQADVIARRLGVTDPSAEQLERITDAILDCQSDVENELGRPLIPVERTLTDLWPRRGQDLDTYQAWPEAIDVFDDDLTVKSRVVHLDGTYDVTFLVGLNGPAEHAIVRFITAHTIGSIHEDASYGFPAARVVTSVSAEGQSLQFAPRPSEDGTVGSLPKLKSLGRFKRRPVFRRDRGNVSLWPNTGSVYIGRR